jgi:cytidine deaminase
MNTRTFTLVVNIFSAGDKLPEEYAPTLLAAAKNAAEKAYAPYSRFRVGAALLFTDETTHSGSNQENSAYPSGLCAERVAVFSAASLFPGKVIKAIAISTINENEGFQGVVSPCGACRQVLAEYERRQNSPIAVWLQNTDGSVTHFIRVADLLPYAFMGQP